MRKVLALIALVLALGACATEEGAPGAVVSPETAEETTPVEEAQPEPTGPEETPEPEQEYGAFGEDSGYTWGNGLAVFLTGLEEFTPSEYAAFDDAPHYVRFTITLVNDTDEPWDPIEFYESVQSGNAEGSAVFDSEQGLNGIPETPVLPGREVKWDVGYGVTEPADLVVEVSPGWDYDPAIFLGGL